MIVRVAQVISRPIINLVVSRSLAMDSKETAKKVSSSINFPRIWLLHQYAEAAVLDTCCSH